MRMAQESVETYLGGNSSVFKCSGGGYHLEVRGGGGTECRGEPFH